MAHFGTELPRPYSHDFHPRPGSSFAVLGGRRLQIHAMDTQVLFFRTDNIWFGNVRSCYIPVRTAARPERPWQLSFDGSAPRWDRPNLPNYFCSRIVCCYGKAGPADL